MTDRLILANLRLVTMAGETPDCAVHDDSLIVIEEGVIAYAGPAGDYSGDLSGAADMPGALCLPGLVACHNPCLWIGEAAGKKGQSGEDYRALVRTIAEPTAAADEDALHSVLLQRTEALSRSGVTACELKSGFGGSPQAELRLAGVLRRFSEQTPMRTKLTLAIGHQFPQGSDPDDILENIEREIVPATYEAGCADAVEVFCDDDAALDLDACSTILELYYKKKTPSRVACDRFADSAGATLPASFYSRCATYLNKTEELDLESLAGAGTVCVIVPEGLETDQDQTRPDIAAIRAANGRFALSPETGPDGTGQFDMLNVLRMGRRSLDLTLEETLAAGTVNAAKALGLCEEAGVIANGRPGDLALFSANDPEALFTQDGGRCMAIVRSGELTLLS